MAAPRGRAGAESDESKQVFASRSFGSDAQKAFILKQGDEGVPVAEICRRAGISQATYFAWRKKFAGLLPTEMKRLKQLEDENARLRKLVDELCREWGVSIRRACSALEMDRSTYHYRSRRPGQAVLEILTAGADVQRDRIEIDVWGWGRNLESWLVDHVVLDGDTARPEIWARLTEFR